MGEARVVYIIDDDESMRAALDSLLRSIGHNTRVYASVSEFLSAQRPDAPGCLILDVRMPGISGLDFQGQLAGLGIHLPVVLMTGHGDVPMSVRGMKAGAVDFLTKPFRDQDMLDAVATAIARDAARRKMDKEQALLRDKFATALAPRTASDAACYGGKDEQTGSRRSGPLRDHCEDSSRRGDEQNGRAHAC